MGNRQKKRKKGEKGKKKKQYSSVESDSSESGGASPSECGIDFYRGEQGSRRIRQGSTRAFSQATLNRSCSSEKAVLSSAEGGKDRPGTKGGRHLPLQSPRMRCDRPKGSSWRRSLNNTEIRGGSVLSKSNT